MQSKASKPFSQDDELRCIARAKRGDLHAFEALYREYTGYVYGLCLRLCASASIAEELTQEAFVRAWQTLPKFRGDAKFATWIHKIAVNLTMSYFRANKIKWQELPEIEQGYQERTEHYHDLEKAIRQLPDGARAVLVLHDIEGYSHPEISGLLDIAVGTSKAQLSRARHLLKRLLI